MQYYANVTGENLTHNVLRDLLSLLNKSHKLNEVDLIEAVDTSGDSLVEALAEFRHTLIGGGSDGAAVNMGACKGMMTQV